MKKKIIFSISCFTLLAVFYLINQSQSISTLIDNIENKDYSYNIEPNLTNIAPQIKKTIENFLYQDKSESSSNRRGRLSQYFSGNSPVYEYDLEILNKDYDKSTATIKRIESSNSEGEYVSYYVDVNIVYYKNNKEISNTNKTYTLIMSKIDNNQLVGYDIKVKK